jgi:hypothetical protein
MNDERLDELERNIHDAIRFHREAYEKAIKPLVDQLVQLQSLRPPPIIVDPAILAVLTSTPRDPYASGQSLLPVRPKD